MRSDKKIKDKGAPLIGVSVALGYALSAANSRSVSVEELKKRLKIDSEKLRATRPTAVNLFWALDRMEKKFLQCEFKDIKCIKKEILKEAC